MARGFRPLQLHKKCAALSPETWTSRRRHLDRWEGELDAWALSVRPGKVFAAAAMFGHSMFGHMERTGADRFVTGAWKYTERTVLTWDLQSMAGQVDFAEFLARLLKDLDGIGMAAPQNTASFEEDM